MNYVKKVVIATLGALILPMAAHADTTVLTHVSSSIGGSGGAGGSGTYWSDMVFPVYTTAQDGWGWAGGAGGVQGSLAINNTGALASSSLPWIRRLLASFILTRA